MTAAEIVALLGLEPHPEGGWYRQTFADLPDHGGRARSTAIYYLLEAGWPAAGTASIPPKSGTGTPARR